MILCFSGRRHALRLLSMCSLLLIIASTQVWAMHISEGILPVFVVNENYYFSSDTIYACALITNNAHSLSQV